MDINIRAKGLLRSALLFSSLLAAFGSSAGEMDIRFCTDTVNGIGSGTMAPDLWYAAALEIDSSTATAFKGCTLDSVRFAPGNTTAGEITVFISRGLSDKPVWEAKVSPGAAGKWQSVVVEGGLKLDGSPFFIGYRLNEPSWVSSPLGFDMEPGSPFNSRSRYSIASSETLLAEKWETPPDGLGNATIGCHVSGSGLPDTFVCASGVRFSEYQKPGIPFNAVMPVVNLGSEPVETLSVEISVNGNAPQTLAVRPEPPVASGKLAKLHLQVMLDDEAVEEQLGFRLASVNGKENPAGNVSATGSVICSTDLFPRAFVVEDFTGLNCGYCPIGYVAMDRLSEDYKEQEGRFVPIAVHNYGQDLMHCDDYDEFVKRYGFASAPASTVNREEGSFPSYNNLLGAWDSMARLSIGQVELQAWFADKKKTAVNVTATTRFARDYGETGYALSFVLTEDNVGPYRQLNYYNDNPDVPEFYQKGERVMMMHNHVARTAIGWDGIEGSVPASVSKGEAYTYSATVSLANCNNPDATRLICLLLRKSDGVIVNAEYVDLADAGFSGIEGAAADGRRVERAEYYTLTGLRIPGPGKDGPCIVKIFYTDGSSRAYKAL